LYTEESLLDRSAVVLAGGFSSRFGQDKALVELNGKPLLKRVVDAVRGIVDEVIIVTKTEELKETYAKLLEPNVKFALDAADAQGPLVGAVAGLETAQGKYSLLLGADMPLVSAQVADLLFELCHNRTAAIPRWTDQRIEPLQAVYHTKTALKAAHMAFEDELLEVSDMVENLGGVRYVSTLVIEQMDPQLKTFFNVNTPVDLKMAEGLLGQKPSKKRR
jgi:molybdopterin-guanine dinucleotide biosynthesis protein A